MVYFKYKINDIAIVYEDDWLMIVDKPSGLLVIPTPKKESRTLTSILNDDLKNKGLSYRLHPCHRLDRETSGLIIYAKGKSAQKKMMQEFKNKKIEKTYIAFVKEKFHKNQGQINIPIEGQRALTKYRVLQSYKDLSIVEIIPLTGRTNQIRIHFKQMGHPILGETKYAFRRDFKLKAKRLCLHAQGLEFVHPLTRESVSVVVPLPLDMKDFLNKQGINFN
jgi:23S rRNA pseudouridine1911/1915/1917 synthase